MDSLPANQDKGKFLKIFLIGAIILLTIVGIIFYFKLQKLTKNEQNINDVETVQQPTYYVGKVIYVGNQGNFVAYSLVDLDGKEIVLLRADDERLKIVEGLSVKITGDLVKGENGQKDTVMVKEVLLQNGSN